MFEELLKLDDERKIEMIRYLMENDEIYWKKILILLSLGEEATPLLDKIAENRVEEMKLLKEIYQLEKVDFEFLKEMQSIIQTRDFSDAMKKIMENREIDKKHAIACKEVIEILKHIPKQYYDKISQEFLDKLQKDASKEYEFQLNSKRHFSEMTLLEETKDLLALINNKFWNDSDTNLSIEELYNQE